MTPSNWTKNLRSAKPTQHGALAFVVLTLAMFSFAMHVNQQRLGITRSPAFAYAVPRYHDGRALAVGWKLDINRAQVRDLTLLPRIGTETAERILAERARLGRYSSFEELGRIRGIGPKTLKRLGSLVEITRPEIENPSSSAQ